MPRSGLQLDPERPGSRWVLLATYAVLVVLGAVLGCLGAFLVPLRIGTHLLPLAVVVAVLGNLAAGRYAATATGSRAGAAMPGLGWLLTVGVLGSARPEGDVIVTGGVVGLSFLTAGAVSALVALSLAPRVPTPRSPTRR